MRLWHKDLIPFLPRMQILGQWRECCLIAKSISENGTPNHILVNKIMDYPIEHFYRYTSDISDEIQICSDYFRPSQLLHRFFQIDVRFPWNI